mmetsp:Transcript_23859/g.34893  ORF Transcript_23859/g.34893 Transcript_23859/m.34893 type:complete len:288 (+) Transcript_23859:16-879(+)|eukprot:CAMPEP_0195510712 /NCGR_PEP_ID=MMETSP0794_2-20130614/3279_1 /TAXON_ID=515487 /ORGANISM="Stephanopyxis turris, Strain CCMP 815" /LENGTH=287 /DNA_ID=CAMNT_0040638189 /DNA_START=16 /DNA_END=879 /DNA_ORIENTATION=+
MRHGRAKAARKTLKFFQLNGDIKPPYKILVDGNFLAKVVKDKVPIHERLGKMLQGCPFALFVARAALKELESLPGEVFTQARQLGLDECEIIEDGSLPPSPPKILMRNVGGGNSNDEEGDDFTEEGMISARGAIRRLVLFVEKDGMCNPRKFFVATQDVELSDEIRSHGPNVPIIKISRAVLLLEAPSVSSKKYATREERGKLVSAGGMTTKEERDLVQTVKKEARAEKNAKDAARQDRHAMGIARCKNKAKQPNPLSCKRKKTAGEGDKSAGKKKRKRTKKKISDT